MNALFWKRVFLAAAAFSFAVVLSLGIPAAAGLELLFGLRNPGPLTVLIYRLFLLMVALFGAGYGLVALDIRKNRGFVQLGVVGKLAVLAAGLHAYLNGMMTGFALLALAGDLVWVVLFLVFLVKSGGLTALETRLD